MFTTSDTGPSHVPQDLTEPITYPSTPEPRRSPSVTRSTKPSSRTMRSNSLRLKALPPRSKPVPPRLLESHYLNSPESIFQRTMSAHTTPSAEDEQWLQDTVPLVSHHRHKRNFIHNVSGEPQTVVNTPPASLGLEEISSKTDGKPLSPLSPPLYRDRHTAGQSGVPRPECSTARSASDTHLVTLCPTFAPSPAPLCYFSHH